jgi:hypothetical protein
LAPEGAFSRKACFPAGPQSYGFPLKRKALIEVMAFGLAVMAKSLLVWA